ncbi:MAG: hypothetical protein N3A66_01810, partial [Planctomycetota bacterium]|nr:hypothetical protein [Planctomycetota bacterium]
QAPIIEFPNNIAQIGCVAADRDAAGRLRRVIVTPQQEGEGDLAQSPTKGLFFIQPSITVKVSRGGGNLVALYSVEDDIPGRAPAEIRDGIITRFLAEQGVGTYNEVTRQYTPPPAPAGKLDAFRLVIADIGISTPHGDPTQPAGPEGANPTNEVVFDDQTPQGEDVGQCLMSLAAKELAGLTTQAVKDFIFARHTWNAPNVGNVQPVYVPNKTGRTTTCRYPAMPVRFDDFGQKRITLKLEGRSWQWRQEVEFFFHYDGTGGRQTVQLPDNTNVTEPNWFYYWSQIVSAQPAQGNPTPREQFFHAGPPQPGGHGYWQYQGGGGRIASWITISTQIQMSLSKFLGLVAHEMQHEHDYWIEIWQGRGYIPAEDGDRDLLRDAWEQAQPGGLERNDMKGGEFDVFETDGNHHAWSDER